MNNSFAEIFSLDVLLGMLDSYYPRLLTQIDRDPDSPTYGSCDRAFWMYRLHDFDSGVLQQAGLTFAALATLAESADLSRCRYLSADKKPYWEELARAINRRTLADFGRGGMVDEYYPGEQSFPATVFAGYATLRAALMLGQTEVLQSSALRKTAETLLARIPSPTANQDAAGAAFLALYSHALNWEPQRAQATVKQLVTRPEQGGNFFEYGGADLGYATVTLNYLGYLQADGGFSTADQLLALGDLIAAFITPSGNLGGEFASRSTTYFLPFGFLQAARLNPALAARFAHLDLQSAYARLDDRYLMHYCLPALARAALDLAQCGAPELEPASTPPGWLIRNFPDVHLVACHKPNSVFLAGL
ncbi:MAG: hypothetical protein JXB38_14050, partial [Anaerolineales bacterium]|nr:hypothetical protein [Anaerolineales bacterium]